MPRRSIRGIDRAALAWICATFALLAAASSAVYFCGVSGLGAALIVVGFLVGGAAVAFGVFWSLPGRTGLRAVAAVAISVFVTAVVSVVTSIASFLHCPLA